MTAPAKTGAGGLLLPSACVVDASVAVKWLVPDEAHPVARRLAAEGGDLRAPGLMRVECANILWKKVRRGLLPATDAGDALGVLAALRIGWVDDAPHVAGALRRALALDHPAYDCVYLEVAASLRLPLVTADRRLAAFSGRDGATVIHLDSFADAPGPSLGAS